MNAKDSKKKAYIMEIKEKTYIDYNFMQKNMTLKSKNPKIVINDNSLKTIKETFELKIDKKRLKGILKRNEVKAYIDNTTILFNKFGFNIENIFIQNDAKFTNNSVFVTLTKFIMKRTDNQNGIILMKEKEFKLSYERKSKKNKLISIKSNALNLMISQEDLYFLILYIVNTYYNTKTTSSISNKVSKKIVYSIYKINNIEVQFELPMINLCLCRNNNYKKVGELLLANTKFSIKSFYKENINNKSLKEFIKQTDYCISINKILLRYIDINNNEIALIKSSNDNVNQKINHIEF